MLTRHFTKLIVCVAFLWTPFTFLHAASDVANTKRAETKKNAPSALLPQNAAGENHHARSRAQKHGPNRLVVGAGSVRKPVGLSSPNPFLQKLEHELGLSGAQVRQLKALYQPVSLPKRGNPLPNRKEIAARQRKLLRILTPRQKDLLVGRYFESAMEASHMPEPGETGLRKYSLGKNKSGAPETAPRDLAEESKILETLQSAE